MKAAIFACVLAGSLCTAELSLNELKRAAKAEKSVADEARRAAKKAAKQESKHATKMTPAQIAFRAAKKAAKSAKPQKRTALTSAATGVGVQPTNFPIPDGQWTYQYVTEDVYGFPLSYYADKIRMCPIDTTQFSGFRGPPAAKKDRNMWKYEFGYYPSVDTGLFQTLPCAVEPHFPQRISPVFEVLPNGISAPVINIVTGGKASTVGILLPSGASASYYPQLRVSYCVGTTAPTSRTQTGTDRDDDAGLLDVGTFDGCAGSTPATEGPYVTDYQAVGNNFGGLFGGPLSTYYSGSNPWYYMFQSGEDYDSWYMRDWSQYINQKYTVGTTSVNSKYYGSTSAALRKYGSGSMYAAMTVYDNPRGAYFYPYGNWMRDFESPWFLHWTCPTDNVVEERYLIVSGGYWSFTNTKSANNIHMMSDMYYKIVCDTRDTSAADPTNSTQVTEALANANTTAEALVVLEGAGIAFAGPQGVRCNAACANGLPTACEASSNNAVCSKCLNVNSCTKAVSDTTTGRQAELNGVLFVACPQLTRSEQTACFAQADCDGLINRDIDACTMNGVTTICPACPSSSKKGLLGLLGLLGIIPLVLLSLCCLLLLCSLRRKKTGDDVMMATFDGGAPPLCTTAAVGTFPSQCVNPTVFA